MDKCILTMMFSKPNQAVIKLQVSANPERITKKSNKHGPEKNTNQELSWEATAA